MQQTGEGVAPPEEILPLRTESKLRVFPVNTPPTTNANRLFPIVILLGLFFWDLPTIAWLYFVVMSGFGIAFNVFYPKG